MSATETIWIEPSDELQEQLGIGAWPLPISPEQGDALSRGRLVLERLVDDIDRQLDLLPNDHPGRPAITEAVVKLSYMSALDLLWTGFHEAAEHVIRVGLHRAPTHLGLHSHLGLAIAGRGMPGAATAQLTRAVALAIERGMRVPMLWVLTARALSEQGRHAEAVVLLEDLTVTLPRQPGFWDLLASERELSEAESA